MVEKFILKFHHLSDHNEEEEIEDDNPNKTDNAPKIFKIEGNPFDFKTPLWYDKLADGKLKDETLALKAKIEGSVLVENECSQDHSIYSYGKFQTGPYVNTKTKWTSNPYLDVNRISGRNYEASNVGDIQENQGHKKIREIVDKVTTMAEPNNYITATQKNFVSNDNEGRMVDKCIVEIQGTFLVKIRNDAFNGNDEENAYEHINKFLEIVRPIKINGLTQD
ncbi:hypothetical protein Tco_1114206 [Tanacetum coccineum]|uniref:Uncharacterized protein n=1 Tax=Tanacetum coccineum TaxID=301880 RepID=A0ABQ5IX06_9ASTR